ncbi:MAG TPA: pyridoxal 5'-phosphate synthase glutaminase subunit PdxT [Limnochordia bacterium]|nr:pyridoxal 5'-phosphate synthase glutaminase subunit PdxT [Limnochordia bacterium]
MSATTPLRIGVLAIQGSFAEHLRALGRLGVEAVPVRRKEQLADLDGLIIPGGESTTLGKLTRMYEIDRAIRAKAEAGMPIYGTCAGMILLAKRIAGGEPPHLGLLDVCVRRNAYGPQTESFEADLAIPELGEAPFRAVFIRAPYIEAVGDGVRVLAAVDGHPVLARSGPLLVSSFHPELTDDLRLHRYFVELVEKARLSV